MFMTPDAWREELARRGVDVRQRPRPAPGQRRHPAGRDQARRRREPAGAPATPAAGALRRGQVPVPLRPTRDVHRHGGVLPPRGQLPLVHQPLRRDGTLARAPGHDRARPARAGEREGRRPHHRQQPRGRGAGVRDRTGSTTTSTAARTSGRWRCNPSTTSGSPRSTSTTAAPTSCGPAHPDIALRYFEWATKLAPTFAPAWGNVGVARRRTGDISGAFAAYSHALTISAEDPTILGNLASLYRATGREHEAELALKAIDRRERHAAHADRARRPRARPGSRASRRSSCTSALARWPRASPTPGSLSPGPSWSGPTTRRAREDLARALRLEPHDATALALLREVSRSAAQPRPELAR